MPRGRQERELRRVRAGNGRHFSDVTFQTLDARLPDSQEDRGLPLQCNCSQEGKVIAGHFARTRSVLRAALS